MQLPSGFTTETFTDWATGSPDEMAVTNDMVEAVSKTLRISREEAISSILAMEDANLIQFATSPKEQPAIFVAPDHEFKDSEYLMAANTLVNYFDATGSFDPTTGKTFRPGMSVDEWAAMSTDVIREIALRARLSARVVIETLQRFEQEGWVSITTKGSTKDCYVRLAVPHGSNLSFTERAVVTAFRDRYGIMDNSADGVLSPILTPKSYATSEYMRAVEAQYDAAAFAEKIREGLPADIQRAFFVDQQMLRKADTYCWFHDPEVAVLAAAATLPGTVAMTRELSHGLAGWWYLADALEVQTIDDYDPIKAILWAWSTLPVKTEFGMTNRVGMIIEAFIDPKDPRYEGSLTPTTRYFWREGFTIDQMLVEARREYQQKYADNLDVLVRLNRHMVAVEYMARFIAAGCLWMQQKIITTQSTPVERHYRKRITREMKLDKPLKDVQIIQLRRRQQVSEAEPGSAKAVDWKCRWVVTGHWRNQPYKTTGKIETIWIDSYVKGPDDKPVKESPRKVYAVKR